MTLKTTEELEEDLFNNTKLSNRQSSVAARLYRGKTNKEIAQELDIRETNISKTKQMIKKKKEKSERTLNAIKNGFDNLEETVEQTFLEPAHAKMLLEDPDRTYIFKETNQERLEKGEDLKFTDRNQLAQALELDKEQVSHKKAVITNMVDNCEETIKTADIILKT